MKSFPAFEETNFFLLETMQCEIKTFREAAGERLGKFGAIYTRLKYILESP